MASHNTALEPWSIELSATPVQEGRTMDLGSSTELITLKPWDPGKQLPLGFSVLGRNRKENYGIYILDSCTNSGACSIFIYGAMGVSFKRQATSCKRQASSNTNQATSLPQSGDKLQVNRKEYYESRLR
jgi:hypothetical protein